jgi:hypothetical protein
VGMSCLMPGFLMVGYRILRFVCSILYLCFLTFVFAFAVEDFTKLGEKPGAAERATAFLELDPSLRTFKTKIQDPSEDIEIFDSSSNMSSKRLVYSIYEINIENRRTLICFAL